MRANTITSAVLVSCLASAAVGAQEGHPLRGTWLGDWGPSASHRNQMTVVMDWDGDNITGVLNPGPDSIPIPSITLDPSEWEVHIEIEATDHDGNRVRYSIDGQIEDLGLPNRTLSGTWRHGDVTGDFKLTRQ
jgi:hypothetical protein